MPNDVVAKWQTIVDLLAELFNIPAGLIMRLNDKDIEVFISSESKGNPYKPGDHEHYLNSGLYCETVINSREKLLVPNALTDKDWDSNPDIKLGMISYLGFPINNTDGTPFGTICVLDNKENAYSDTYIKVLEEFRDIVQNQLALVNMNHVLGEENKQLSDYINEIKTLRGIIPICMHCKNIRDDENYWQSVEEYFRTHSDVNFSHGICPDCTVKYYSEYITLEGKNMV